MSPKVINTRQHRLLNFQLSDLTEADLAGPLGRPCTEQELRMSFVPANHQPEPLRPQSQKAATMSVEPTDEQISMVVAITSADEATAKRYLRVKQCNLETAVNAILDGEDIAKLEQGISWDPNIMSADRDGHTNLLPLGASAAPTRGNSPAPSLKESAPINKDAEDADLARALAQSQELSGPYSGWTQETGTISKDGTELRRIGPATAKEYEESHWGMVLHNASELVPDVSIEERTQQEGDPSPRFIKHTPVGDYTPSLITICHSIPMVREAFLLAGQGIDDYGQDADWWKGASIPKPRIVHTIDGNPADHDTDRLDEFVAELQRLTAFLDSSSRVYANIGGLMSTEIMKEANSEGELEQFLDSYTQVVSARGGEQAEQIAGLFTSHVGVIGQANNDTQGTRVFTLKANCADTVAEEAKPDLTECLERLIWSTDSEDPNPQQFYLERAANVLVVKLEQEDRSQSHLNIRVPATLVLDKYIEENVPMTRPLREQLVSSKRRIKKIADVEQQLTQWTKDGKQLDARQLLKHTLGHFSGQNRRDVDQADKTNNASLSADLPSHYPQIAQQLETVIKSIDEKLKLLDLEKEKARKAISDLSKSTVPGLEAQESQYRYTLRGVATKPNITYLLRPKTEANELITTAEHSEGATQNGTMTSVAAVDEETTTPPGYQWWRIDYEVNGQSAKVNRTRADDFDVIRAVELEHSTALLVYASEDAVDDLEPSALPTALAEFVLKDNDQLKADIEASKRNPPPYQDQDPMRSFIQASVEGGDDDDDDDASSTVAHHDGEMYRPTGNTINMIDHQPRMSTEAWLGGENDPEHDPEPVEIHLDRSDKDVLPKASSQTNCMDDASGPREMEMMEKRGMPSLIPAPRTSVERQNSGDNGMSEVGESQDMGIGGATSHIEEARKGG